MYAKLYSSITMSSIWNEDAETCKVWVTLMAQADREGYVWGSIAGLAAFARLPIEATKKAVDTLLSPDPNSADLQRNPSNQGRRLEVTDGGWRLINYDHYRQLRDDDERREREKEKKRKQRAASVPSCPPPSPSVPPSESYSDAEACKKESSSPNASGVSAARPRDVEEVRAEVERLGYQVDPEAFWAFYESKGWKVGKNPIVKWRSCLVTWQKRNGSSPPGKSSAQAGLFEGKYPRKEYPQYEK